MSSMVNETLANFIKQSTQQREKRKDKEGGLSLPQVWVKRANSEVSCQEAK
jgi:hypothetical protein